MPFSHQSQGPNSNQTNTHQGLFLLIAWLIMLTLVVPVTPKAGFSVELIWTAPGDDDQLGKGSFYDIRYCSDPIESDTSGWWNSAIIVNSAPEPSLSGHKDSCMIHNLSIDSSFYFAIKTCDDANNWSDISNVGNIPPLFCIDITGDDKINILDAVYLLDYLYGDISFLQPGINGDIDNSGNVNILDVLYFINFFYKNGPPPDCMG